MSDPQKRINRAAYDCAHFPSPQRPHLLSVLLAVLAAISLISVPISTAVRATRDSEHMDSLLYRYANVRLHVPDTGVISYVCGIREDAPFASRASMRRFLVCQYVLAGVVLDPNRGNVRETVIVDMPESDLVPALVRRKHLSIRVDLGEGLLVCERGDR